MSVYLGDKLIASSTDAQALTLKEDLQNKVTNFNNPNDTTYPTTNAVNNSLLTKAGVDLSNLTDTGNAVIDSRITAIMNSGAYATRGDNWVKFTNGLMMVDGYFFVTTAKRTITFPKPFIDANYAIVGTMHNPNTTAGNGRLSFCDKTTTSCEVYWATPDQYGDDIHWIAIRV